jgi:prolyl oligopeptidase
LVICEYCRRTRQGRNLLSGNAGTADHDDRVVPSHSFKFTAAMQAAHGCAKPILIRVETQGSHGYRPTDKRIAELADEWAFALAHLKPPS